MGTAAEGLWVPRPGKRQPTPVKQECDGPSGSWKSRGGFAGEAWQTATLNASKKLPRPEWLVKAAGDGLMILMPGKLAFPQTATLNASKKRMPRPECLKENSRASFKASQTAALNASANGRPRPECLVGAAAEGNRQP